MSANGCHVLNPTVLPRDWVMAYSQLQIGIISLLEEARMSLPSWAARLFARPHPCRSTHNAVAEDTC